MGLSVALVAWSRLYLAVHDRIDVYGGLVWVIGVGGGRGAALAAAQGWVPSGAGGLGRGRRAGRAWCSPSASGSAASAGPGGPDGAS